MLADYALRVAGKESAAIASSLARRYFSDLFLRFLCETLLQSLWNEFQRFVRTLLILYYLTKSSYWACIKISSTSVSPLLVNSTELKVWRWWLSCGIGWGTTFVRFRNRSYSGLCENRVIRINHVTMSTGG